jgi:hypothetical protein
MNEFFWILSGLSNPDPATEDPGTGRNEREEDSDIPPVQAAGWTV